MIPEGLPKFQHKMLLYVDYFPSFVVDISDPADFSCGEVLLAELQRKVTWLKNYLCCYYRSFGKKEQITLLAKGSSLSVTATSYCYLSPQFCKGAFCIVKVETCKGIQSKSGDDVK